MFSVFSVHSLEDTVIHTIEAEDSVHNHTISIPSSTPSPNHTPTKSTKLKSDSTSKLSSNSEPHLDYLPDRPIQLLRPDPVQHRKLEIVDRNVQHLHHITTAVAVVAVVGKFHSGKSFLLNQLMGKQEGFGVGPSVRPQTMGIWMWGKVSG